MACPPTKCCFCGPLKPGLMAWALVKLVLIFAVMVCLIYVSEEECRRQLFPGNQIVSRRLALTASQVLVIVWPGSVCLLHLMLSIIFTMAVYYENYRVVQGYLVYSITEVILASAGFVLYDFTKWWGLSAVVHIVWSIYLIVLIRSELRLLKKAGGARVVLDTLVPLEEAKTYNYVYCNETPDLRKPLFPVEELQRLRQQMGVNNV